MSDRNICDWLGRTAEVLDSFPEAVLVVRRDGQVAYANPHAALFFGYHRGELAASRYDELFATSERRRQDSLRASHFAKYAAGAATCSALAMTTALRKDGTTVLADVTLSPLGPAYPDHAYCVVRDRSSCAQVHAPLPQGETELDALDDLELRVGERTAAIERANAALRAEVAERKQTEIALRRSEERWRSLFEHANDAVFVAEPGTGRILDFNGSASRRLGYTREELLRMSVFDLLAPGDVARGVTMMGRLLSAGSLVFYLAHRRKDGSSIPVEISSRLIEDGDDRLVLSFARDISERLAAQEALRRSEEQLRHSQKMEAIGRLAGGVAHDFNNLLTIIASYTWLIEELAGNVDPLSRYVSEVVKATDRAAALTQQLLVFSRRQVLSPRVLDLNAVVSELTKELLKRIIGEDVELSTNLDPTLRPVRVDPGQIEQVILNLAINARDAMPRGGKLTMSTRSVAIEPDQRQALPLLHLGPGWYASLSVEDSGTGMDDNTLAHIFEPFFTTKGEKKGTGLGLATVYGIVKQSGGDISVTTAVGSGSTFTIYLPCVSAPVDAARKTGSDRRDLSGAETVLVVEDETLVRALVRDFLNDCGYTVLEAEDGVQALKLARQRGDTIDAMIVDVVMPGMGGPEFVDAIRQTHRRAKILYTSGYVSEEIAQRGFAVPSGNLIEKPFSVAALAARLRALLDGSES